MKKFIKFSVFSFLALLLFGIPLASKAFFEYKMQNSYVPKNEIISGDYIAFSESLIIEGKIDGDVIAFSANTKILGDVSGDVIVVGSNLKIGGKVSGNVRVAGSENVEISGEIGRNLNAAASIITIADSAKINRNAYLAGETIKIYGKISGGINALANNIILSGEIEKNAFVNLGAGGKLTLNETANINGGLTYKAISENQIDIKENAAIVGEINFEQKQTQQSMKEKYNSIFLFGKILSLLGMLAIGLILISLVPKLMLQIAEEAEKNPGMSIIWGLIFLVITPIVSALLLFTVIGIPLSLIIIPLYLILLYLSKIIGGIIIGLFILKQIMKKSPKAPNLFLAMVLGLITLTIISAIPAIGWAIKLLATMLTIGAIIAVKKRMMAEWK